jgi:O-antigen/teichoic acid export membrane protein
VLATELGPDRYGSFAFFVASLGIIGVFSEVGLFTALARLVVHAPDEPSRRRLLGGGVALAGAIIVAFAFAVVALALVVEPVFDLPLRTAMLLAAPVSAGIALEVVVLYLCQGTGRYDLLVLRNLVARPLPLAILGVLVLTGSPSLTVVCLTYVAGPALISVIVMLAVRPDFSAVPTSIREIRSEARRAGDFGIYLGRALGTSTYNLDRILVAYFLTPADVSYYALAFALTTPVMLGSQNLASLSFARLARVSAIPRRLVLLNGIWLMASAVALSTALAISVPLVLDEYKPMLTILAPVVLTSVVMGLLQLPNQFLIAHGRGGDLRSAGLVFSALNLVLNFALIPAFGIQGAAYASLIASVAMLISLTTRYRSARLHTTSATPAATPAVAS